MSNRKTKKQYSDVQKLFIYLVLSFALSFLWFYIANPKRTPWDDLSSEMQSFVSLSMLFPVIAHVLTRWITKEGFSLSGPGSMMLGISFRNKRWIYFLLAMLLPCIYTELGNLITLAVCPKLYDPEYYKILGVDKSFLLWLPINSIIMGSIVSFAAFGEEGGWRGYMMPKLIHIMGKRRALIVGGIIWGLWHAPLTCIGHNFGTDYPGFPYLGIFMMCTYCILCGILLTFLTEMSGSVWPAAILHAVNNAQPSILNGYINYENVPGLMGTVAPWIGRMTALAIAATAVLLIWKKKRNG